jgi:RibD C-terminal domain
VAAVVWHVTMSLDGFIAGPDDAMDWVFDYFSEAEDETAGEVIETTGAIIMGRHTYEVEDRTRSWSSSALHLRSSHQSPIKLTADHERSPELGEVIGLHRTHGGDVLGGCLGVLPEHAAWLLRFPRALYYSAELTAGQAALAPGHDPRRALRVTTERTVACTGDGPLRLVVSGRHRSAP